MNRVVFARKTATTFAANSSSSSTLTTTTTTATTHKAAVAIMNNTSQVTKMKPEDFLKRRSSCFQPLSSLRFNATRNGNTRFSSTDSTLSNARKRGYANHSNERDNGRENSEEQKKETVGEAVQELRPSPLQRAPMPKHQRYKTDPLRDELGALKKRTNDGEEKDGEDEFDSAIAILRNARGSPKRFNAFCKVLRGLSVDDALVQCSVSPKKSARVIQDVIKSALANAVHNNGLEEERLIIHKAMATKGQYLQRIYMHAKGRAGTMHKGRAHIRIEVREGDALRKVRVDGERVLSLTRGSGDNDDRNNNSSSGSSSSGENDVVIKEAPWVTRRKAGSLKYQFAKEHGIL